MTKRLSSLGCCYLQLVSYLETVHSCHDIILLLDVSLWSTRKLMTHVNPQLLVAQSLLKGHTSTASMKQLTAASRLSQ